MHHLATNKNKPKHKTMARSNVKFQVNPEKFASTAFIPDGSGALKQEFLELLISTYAKTLRIGDNTPNQLKIRTEIEDVVLNVSPNAFDNHDDYTVEVTKAIYEAINMMRASVDLKKCFNPVSNEQD